MAQKTNQKKFELPHIKVVPDSQMPAYEKDPAFIASLEKAMAFIKKVGLPPHLDKKKQN